MMNILVVCHGNVNRSPACAAVLQRELPSAMVQSRGFVVRAGCAAKKMRDAMKARGYNLESHVPKKLDEDDILVADEVVLMDGGNYRRWRELSNKPINLLGDSIGLSRIPDPAYMRRDSTEFEATVDLIIRASKVLAKELRK